MIVIRLDVPSSAKNLSSQFYTVKQRILWPYWRRRLASERFDKKHRLRRAQPPRQMWEIIVPWHTRGDMRLPLVSKPTFWKSLYHAIQRSV